jgi:hypothetical protein
MNRQNSFGQGLNERCIIYAWAGRTCHYSTSKRCKPLVNADNVDDIIEMSQLHGIAMLTKGKIEMRSCYL